MNREIKFRAWYKELKFMTDDIFIDCDGHIYDRATETHNTPHIEIEKDNDHVVMQYSGLKDCKDKKIYEGDLVECEYGLSEVYFSIGCFMVKHINDIEQISRLLCDRTVNKELKVVGNIYETPELLEK